MSERRHLRLYRTLRFRLRVLLSLVFVPGAVPLLAHMDISEEIIALSAQIQLKPQSSQLYLQRGELYRNDTHWRKALADFERAQQLDQNTVLAELGMGRTWLDQGDFQQAIDHLNRALVQQPDNVRARITRATARRLNGEPLAAASDYELVIQAFVKPQDPLPEYYLERARALEAAGSDYIETALETLDAGIIRLGDIRVLQDYAVALERKRGNYPEALRRLDEIIDQAARKDSLLLMRGDLVRESGQVPRSAMADTAAQADIEAPAENNSLAPSSFSLASIQQALTMWLFSSEPAHVTRGPYLQSGTPSSVIVKWRTSIAMDSTVAYGNTAGNLTNSVSSVFPTTEHEITLTNLSPDTRYYYSVGSRTVQLAGNDNEHWFVTSPVTGTAKPTRIWVLGDSGSANANAIAVANAYRTFTGATHTDLWMMLGDNAYTSGTDSQYQAAVFDIYPDILRNSVLWTTLGNHDGSSADSSTQSGPYYDIFTLPKSAEAGGIASGTEAYYSFDYANIHFICLDSHETDRAPGGAMLTWAAEDIAQTTQDWIIAFWHHPPYSKGSHNSDTERRLVEMRENALPILEAAGVDLVLSGHSHSYERSFLLHGHYGTSETLTNAMKIDAGNGRVGQDGAYKAIYDEENPDQGAVYITAGSSGKISGGPLNHPVMVHASLKTLGSLVLDIDGNRLDATFVSSNGRNADSFTILKNPDICPSLPNSDQTDADGDLIGDACG